MAEPEPQPPRIELVFQVPDALAAGVYSNAAQAWYTATEFTLDFAVTQPVKPVTFEDEDRTKAVMPARVVARVKIPPPMLFKLISELSKLENAYEDQFGPIREPAQPGPEPPMFPPGVDSG